MRIPGLTLSIMAIAFLFAACQKDTPANKSPIVDAGKDTTIQLAGMRDTITLAGSATDADGKVIAYQWTQI